MRPFLPLIACVCCVLPACTSSPALGQASPVPVVEVAEVQRPQGETAAWWYRSGAARAAANGAMDGRARNVIVFLGDGMSLTTVAAARILEGQRKGDPGEENQLAWEGFPHTALAKTYNTDSQTPDSAGTMTAIAAGVKTHMGAIGVASGRRSDCADSLTKPLLSWLHLADSAGLATGVVTTARLTHATPAAVYAHSPERNWENDTELPEEAKAAGCHDIAQQLLMASRFGRGPTVALGGGRGEFMPAQQRDPEYDDKVGKRLDGRDLVAEWRAAHPRGRYVWNTRQLQDAAGAPSLLGLFEYDHMQFDHDRARGPAGEPSLADMTRVAIETLSRQPHGYVLMVEGARIDHAHHYGNAYRALDETIAFSDAVRAAVEATS
ncbi:MAG TPA: alkaline phosphatase, partial [Pseudoxanthomonas sp.]|nr:alkaline phosphatase [Pseudoxanthomonas sp.]